MKAHVSAWADCITGAIDQTIHQQKLGEAGFVDVEVASRASYGLEDFDSLDEASREMLTKGLDGLTIPSDVRLYSAQIVARKPIA